MNFYADTEKESTDTDFYLPDWDYNQLREKYKLLVQERNDLLFNLQFKQNELNAQQSSIFSETILSCELHNSEVEQIKTDIEHSFEEKIKMIRNEYEDKIYMLEREHSAQLQKYKTPESLGNLKIQDILNENKKLQIQNKQLQNDFESLLEEKKRIDLEIQSNNELKLKYKNLLEMNNNLEDKIKTLNDENLEASNILSSYKLTFMENSEYITTISEENKSYLEKIQVYEEELSRINSIQICDVSNEFTLSQSTTLIDTHESLARAFNLFEEFCIQFNGMTVNKSLLENISIEYREIQDLVSDINYRLINAVKFDKGSDKMCIIQREIPLIYEFEQNVDKLLETYFETKESFAKNKIKADDFHKIRDKLNLTIRIVKEQTNFIGILISQVNALKETYKKNINWLKQRILIENQRHIDRLMSHEKRITSTEKRASNLRKCVTKLKAKVVEYSKENDYLNSQLKFLVRQKILLSQQIEEYEWHIMQNFTSAVFSDENQ